MAQAEAERRVVTVLMADLAGSTGIAERLGPERAKFLMDEVVAIMTREVERFGGTVAQLAGDGMLALFGAPVAHEDDAERAVRATLAIRAQLAEYGRDVTAAYGVALEVRQALNTGTVVVSQAEAGENRYNALGDTVNVAARLQELSGSGEIVAGEATARVVTACVELEPLGDADLRGREVPVKSFRVLGERQAAPEHQLPLIGRDFELSLLGRVISDLSDGLGVIVVVTGEPGIGKTRLVAEAVTGVDGGMRVLEGHGVAYASGFPLWPVREMLREWLAASPETTEAQVRLDLKAKLARFAEAGEEDPYPYLARVLGLHVENEPGSPLPGLSGDTLRERTFEALEWLLTRLSADQPLCLVLEDLHWADDQTIELIERLQELTEREPIGLVMLYRSERDARSWGIGERARQRFPHRYREIELRPLADDAARRLALEAAGGNLPEECAAPVIERAGGNPFFISEAVRDLVERGTLDDVAEAEGAVPSAVQGALQARFDRLTPGARSVLNVAAVIGRSFSLPMLQWVIPDDSLPESLSELQRLELIVEERRRPAPEFRFRHGLVQEVAYASMLDTRRMEVHRQVAGGLEDLWRECGCVPLPELAHHYSEAGDAERASDYLIQAGDEARSLWAHEDAVAFYRRARDFLARAGDDRRSRETLFKLALVHHLSFRFTEAEAAYDEAFSCGVTDEVPVLATERLTSFAKRAMDLAPGYAYSSEAAEISALVFRGLLETDADLNVMPSLADNFRVSGDGLTYLFRLRESATWSDGKPVTAHDFVFTWERMVSEGLPARFLLDDIARAEALDDRTLEVELHEPRSYFPYVLTVPLLFPWPKHLVERLGDAWMEPENMVGNGPYDLVSVDDSGIRLTASPSWVGPRGNVAEIVLRHQPGREEGWDSGAYDVVQGHPDRDEEDGPGISMMPSLGSLVVAMHPEGPLEDVRVRRAISRHLAGRVPSIDGVDRTAGEGGVAPPTMPGHRHRVWEGVEADPAALLADAGFPGGEGLDAIDFVVHERNEELGAQIAELLADIGVRADMRVVEDNCAPGGAPMWITSWVADYPDPHGFFRGLIGPDDFQVPPDEELSDLLARARSCRDRDQRLKLYGQIDQHIVTGQALLVPLAYKRSALFQRPWVGGMRPNPLMSATLADAVVDPELRVQALLPHARAS